MTFAWKPIQQKLSKMSIEDRLVWLAERTVEEKLVLAQYPEVWMLDKQLAPEDDWFYHWFRGARGVGKTLADIVWLHGKVRDGAEEVAIVVPNHGTFKKEILPILKAIFPTPTNTDITNGLIEIDNKCLIKIYSSEEEIRGCNAEFGVAEEMTKWCNYNQEKIEECWQVFNAGVRNKRAKPHPQIFCATTSRSYDFFRKWEQLATDDPTTGRVRDPAWSMTTMTIDEAKFLNEDKKQQIIKELKGTRLGRQELYCEILSDNPNALWTQEIIDRCRVSVAEFNHKLNTGILHIRRIIVTVDPAVSTNKYSDETGLMVMCLCDDGHVYLMEDKSGRFPPSQWAQEAVDQYRDYNANQIVLEKNQGGNLLEMAIHNIDRYAKTKLVHASVGKKTRFEPVCVAYERGEVHHVGVFAELEKQMMNYDPFNDIQTSPDRIDAVSYGVYELLLATRIPIRRSANALGVV